MAGPASAGGLSYDPVADLANRYPDWTLHRVSLGWGLHEAMSHRARVILLDIDDPPELQRCSLAHAIAHLDLGHRAPATTFFESRQEREADRLAASRLLPLWALAAAVPWTCDPAELARELGVDNVTLWGRLTHLTLQERRTLEGLAEALQAAA